MSVKMIAASFLLVARILALNGFADTPVPADKQMTVPGESLVLAKCVPGRLCFDQVVKGSLTLRSTYVAGKRGSVVYTEGRDYVADYAAGTIARTPNSRIPDFATNCLYGQKDFDHSKFPSYQNHAWFVWADYQTTNGRPWAKANDQRQYLKAARRKLEVGGPFMIASYGDSITAGGEASDVEFQFQHRFASQLRARFPKARIAVRDVSIPGYASTQGIWMFDTKIGTVERPDLTLVGFGMNDHNLPGGGGVDPEVFKNNLVTLVKMIRERKGGDVVLFSAFPPNADWHYGTHRMAQFAAATKQAAREAGCAYVDIYSTWEMALRRKDQSSLLGNNINHPNDFGHWLYAQAFVAMIF